MGRAPAIDLMQYTHSLQLLSKVKSSKVSIDNVGEENNGTRPRGVTFLFSKQWNQLFVCGQRSAYSKVLTKWQMERPPRSNLVAVCLTAAGKS